MFLFRRHRREKEEAPADRETVKEATPATPPASPTPPTAPPAAAPSPPASAPAPRPPERAAPSVAPPPLPEGAPGASARPRSDRPTFTTCFVCGAVLENRTCPNCRITWLD